MVGRAYEFRLTFPRISTAKRNPGKEVRSWYEWIDEQVYLVDPGITVLI